MIYSILQPEVKGNDSDQLLIYLHQLLAKLVASPHTKHMMRSHYWLDKMASTWSIMLESNTRKWSIVNCSCPPSTANDRSRRPCKDWWIDFTLNKQIINDQCGEWLIVIVMVPQYCPFLSKKNQQKEGAAKTIMS